MTKVFVSRIDDLSSEVYAVLPLISVREAFAVYNRIFEYSNMHWLKKNDFDCVRYLMSRYHGHTRISLKFDSHISMGRQRIVFVIFCRAIFPLVHIDTVDVTGLVITH